MAKIQHPEVVVLNGERYPIARNKRGARLWREVRVPVQPGGGEKPVTFDSWDLGMGYSRHKSPYTYEYSTGINATSPHRITLGPVEGNTAALGTGHTAHRLVEFSDSVYVIGVTTADNDLYFAHIDSTGNRVAHGEVGAGQADGPPGQCAVWENDLYVGVTAGTAYKVTAKSDSGTANVAVTCTANTLTDTREAWTANEWIGMIVTCDSKTMTVASNNATTLTGFANWSASQPADGKAWTLTGTAWVRGNGCDALHFCRVGRDLWGVPLGNKAQLAKLPAGSTWTTAWGTDDTAVGTSPWGGLYTAGDTGKDIASLIEWGRWVHVGKPDGLFSGDSDGNLWNQLPGVMPSASNCLRLAYWQGMLLAPTITGLYRYTGLGARTQGPEILTGNESVLRGGYFRALAQAGHWLYGAYKAKDDKTYILTARLREPDEPGRGELIWHPIYVYSSTNTVSDMLASSLTSPPTLWIALSTDDDVHEILLNDDGSVASADSGYLSESGATQSIYLPKIDLDSPGTTKAGHFIEVHTGGTLQTTNKTVKVYAAWDGGSFNQVGSTIEDVGTTFTRLFWTAGTNDTGRSLQLRIDMTSNALDYRPEVTKLTVNLIESPRREPGVRCSLRVANMLDKKRSAYHVEEDLNALDSGSAYTMSDPDDPAAGTVKVIVHDMEFVPTEDPGEIQGERQCNLTLRVVEYS